LAADEEHGETDHPDSINSTNTRKDDTRCLHTQRQHNPSRKSSFITHTAETVSFLGAGGGATTRKGAETEAWSL